MDSKLSVTGCCYVILLVSAQVLRGAGSAVGARGTGVVRTPGPGDFGVRFDSDSRGGRRAVPGRPGPVEDPQDEGGYFSGVLDRVGPEPPRGRPGPRGTGRRRRPQKRGRVHRYGKFNSDTHGCHGIQTRSCAAPADCAGCLGLYTCDLTVSTCKLKGISRPTDVFSQSLRDI